MSTSVKDIYENWFRNTQPLDQPATQIIEVRRAFYSGVLALMLTDITDEEPTTIMAELLTFFDGEVQTGFGLPKT